LKEYKITDRSLIFLAVANILMIVPLIWSMWMPISFWWTKHTGNILPFEMNIIFNFIGIELIVLTISAIAFLKRWRNFLFFYIPYSIYMLPGLISSTISYFKHPQLRSNFYLSGDVHTWAYEILLIATLVVTVIYTIERIALKKIDNSK